MKKALKIILIVLLVLVVLIGGFLIVVTRDSSQAPQEVSGSENPYITQLGKTMVSAHRSGGGIAPENTMMAFKNCIESGEFTIDIFEFDLHITADDELVLLHDETLDRTSDSVAVFGKEEVKPSEKTYEELRKLNMGEGFTADDGQTPFQGLRGADVPDDLRIVRLQDVFDYLTAHGDYKYIIELKDGGELGRKACDKLYGIMQDYGLLKSVVVGTFHGEISDYMDEKHPDMYRSASIKEVASFYFSALFNIKRDKADFKFVALQIPDDDFIIKLGTSRVVNYAHRYDIAVQYWTINEPEKVKRLSEIGADAIMSDDPDMAYRVLAENGAAQ